MRRQIFAFMVMTLMSQALWAVDVGFSGISQWNSGYEVNTGEWQTNQLAIKPEITARFDSGTKVTAKLLARWDLEDKLEPGRPAQPFRSGINRRIFPDNHTDLELRELFVDDYLGNTFVRIGKQQIVWGQADGLRVLDVINPLNHREFILPEMEDRRIPLWSAQVEIPVDSWSLQLVWVPDSTVTEAPEPGAAYALLDDPFNGAGTLTVDRPKAFSESDYGARLGRYWKGWDLTLNYLYHTIDDPIITVDPSEQAIRASYNRSHLFGITAANAFGDYTFRLEAGYESERKYTSTVHSLQSTDELSYVLGLDYSGLTDTLLSGQFFQSIRDKGLDVPRTEENATLLLRRDFMNQVVQLESLLIYSFENRDALWQLSADYQLTTNVQLNAGVDLFSGDREGQLGRFRDRSRLNVGIELGF